MAMPTKVLFGLILFLAVANSTAARARWGCGASSSNGAASHNSGQATEAIARTYALQDCEKSGGKNCRIIGCSPEVDTVEEARARWPLPRPPAIQCGEAFGTQC